MASWWERKSPSQRALVVIMAAAVLALVAGFITVIVSVTNEDDSRRSRSGASAVPPNKELPEGRVGIHPMPSPSLAPSTKSPETSPSSMTMNPTSEIPTTGLPISSAPTTLEPFPTFHPTLNTAQTNAPTSSPSPTTFGSSETPVQISSIPSFSPTDNSPPNSTRPPSQEPTKLPSRYPTGSPTANPTKTPTAKKRSTPSFSPTLMPTMEALIPSKSRTVFCVFSKTPFMTKEALVFETQLEALEEYGCEFAVHLGNFKRSTTLCDRIVYKDTRGLLVDSSPVPIFMLIGENEWRLCPLDDDDDGVKFWMWELQDLHQQWQTCSPWVMDDVVYWDGVSPQSKYFVRKKTAFIMLNFPGIPFVYDDDWADWLVDLLQFTLGALLDTTGRGQSSGAVIMSQAGPNGEVNEAFFGSLRAFVGSSPMLKELPILYLHSHGDEWIYEPNFMGLSNMLRIQYPGGVSESNLPLKIITDPEGSGPEVDEAFRYRGGPADS